MLTLVERVLFLQNVDVFSEVSTEKLSLLASVAVEMEAEEGQPLYAEADPSDAMYLVLKGEVRLHRGETTVTRANAREAFGTWALFDDELRVVSATCECDTRLLRIDKAAFIELLADNVEITQGVLKAVVRRLRSVLDRVGGGTGRA